MATKEVKKEEPAEAVAPPKKSKKLLIIVIAAVVVVLGLGLGLGFMMGHKKAAPADANGEQQAEEKPAKKKEEPQKPPVFVALEPFTVNLQPDNGGEQFLQAVVSLRVPDEKKGEELKAYMPQIRHEILSLASAKKASEITTPDGREALADDIKDTVNEVLGYEPPRRSKRKKKDSEVDEDAPVMAVYFTQFIVQ